MAKVVTPGPAGLKFWRPLAWDKRNLNAWNIEDKSASITLSSADKTATGTAAGTTVGARSTQARVNGSAGKYYAEFIFNTVNIIAGIAPASLTLGFTSSCFVVSGGSGDITVNSSVLGSVGSALIAADVLSVAWDAGAELVWFRKNAGNWNNSGTANPATGVGGLNCSFAAATDHCLYFRGFNAGDNITVRTEVAEFSYTVPSGFASWMGEGEALLSVTGTGALPSDVAALEGEGTVEDVAEDITGTGALAGQAAAASGTGTANTLDAWNTLDKSTNITLSDGDKTATLTAAVTSGVRSTTKYLNGTESGKFYVEFLLPNVVGTISSQVGIREVSASLTSTAGSTAQCASNSGNILTGNATIIGNIGGSPLVDDDIVCMAWAPATERIWFRKNDGPWNNNASADPATNTAGLDISVLNNTDHALFFLIASTGNGASTTVRTEVAEFSYAVPSGFASWMGETLEATGTGAVAADVAFVSGSGVSESVATGALAAQVSTIAGSGLSTSVGTGAFIAEASTVIGAGASSSTGTGSLVAGSAEVAGTGTAAAANTGALVAEAATVEGLGVSGSTGSGALQAGAATVAGAGKVASAGSGALVAGPATIAGAGEVIAAGAAIGTGALVAAAATLAGEGEVTGEVAPPVSVGGGRYRPTRLLVEGIGYGILPQLEGEAHGLVVAVGAGVATLPAIAGANGGTVGVAGRSAARLGIITAAAIGDRGQAGLGSGSLVGIKAAAIGRHDDGAAIVAFLLAA